MPWHTLLEDKPAKAEEHDELARLRALHEDRQKGGLGERDSPSQDSDAKKKEKKKKKKKKDKERKSGKG